MEREMHKHRCIQCGDAYAETDSECMIQADHDYGFCSGDEFCLKTELSQMTQKQRLMRCAEILERYAREIEPLFKAGSKGFANGTDWWCIIAGWRHNNLANIRLLRSFAEELDRPKTNYADSPPWLRTQMMRQRRDAIAASEVESPCGNGCVMTWQEQYGKADVEAVSE